MRVGVTGASGLIGSALVEALLARGDDVVRFTRGPSSDPGHVAWDPERGWVDRVALASAGPLDAVVNLAGVGIGDRRWSVARKAAIVNSRVAATAALCDALAAVGPPASLVSGSAVGYYGSREDDVLDESSRGGQDFLAALCARWEEVAGALRSGSTAVALARSGIVMSAAGGALAKQLPLFRAGLGGRLGSGRQWVSPVSRRDEVRALLFAIDRRLDGPINVVAPLPVTNAQLTTALAHRLHRPGVVRVPRAALRLVLGELADGAVLASQRATPRVLLGEGFTFLDADLEAILTTALADRARRN
ncbi:MAG: TIGR01777 family oxidoreductase [Acidobacteriota bacterium]|nr:TIGR01777 family oxidoreductase [Acidobacteriota bacterium]